MTTTSFPTTGVLEAGPDFGRADEGKVKGPQLVSPASLAALTTSDVLFLKGSLGGLNLGGPPYGRVLQVSGYSSNPEPTPLQPAWTKQAMRLAIAGALLASERAGTIRLEIRERQELFGLIRWQQLGAVRLTQANLPASSLELTLLRTTYSAFRKLTDVVYAWIGANSEDPWQDAAEKMQVRLGRKGLMGLLEYEESVLWFFTTRKTCLYVKPEGVRMLTPEAVAGAGDLLLSCIRERPVLFEMLLHDIDNAFSRRTINTD